MKKKKTKFFISFSISLILIWILIGYFSSWYLTRRYHSVMRPDNFKFKKEEIELTSEDNLKISAWYVAGNTDKSVIILSGIGSDRSGSISRAKIYLKEGYSVLLPDLRGTGKSEGNFVSFGWDERKDLKACYHFLKRKGFKKIAAHGCSLGAATITYSLSEIKDYDFIILESCYDNLDHAFSNRVEKFHLPDCAYLPVRFFVENKINAEIDQLNPEEFIKLAKIPVLIMAGDSEDQIKMSETQKLYNNCSSIKKQLYIFKGGKHEDFCKRFSEEYKKALLNFHIERQ